MINQTGSAVTIADLLQVIRSDYSLSKEEKEHLTAKCSDPTFTNRLLYGGAGAGIGYVIAKYLKLGSTTKVLLSLAGFGVGSLLLKHTTENPERGLKYNSSSRMYEIK